MCGRCYDNSQFLSKNMDVAHRQSTMDQPIRPTPINGKTTATTILQKCIIYHKIQTKAKKNHLRSNSWNINIIIKCFSVLIIDCTPLVRIIQRKIKGRVACEQHLIVSVVKNKKIKIKRSRILFLAPIRAYENKFPHSRRIELVCRNT